ncbi:aspartyl aminopeptidase [Coniophora puteana RWD-64-598 SS2]|uniref:aspartyl aminopeptidase n=1 Tax=Coniophora puteana (strain RWD-64-598) TaxID=741705 RepID=A0A5M3MUX3_CONPW|nr:aspartyl aminopeptidase [Coniophora puteana RWD-64-598 SS2]EIW82401.1 aspartyl aminopeptidase [Coniophora puteana RWD-64-598 SS2]
MMIHSAGPEAAKRFLTFVNASPTPFHAVHNASARLEAAGFQKIRETDDWEKALRPQGKYYFTRNQSALVAFTIPSGWKQGSGVSIVATHVDSPNLKVRPISKRSKVGYLQVGVETYGGGIWHSWLDRDLSLAGRVIISKGDGNFHSKLVKIDRPLLRIPTLAIHLDRSANDAFKLNTETEFVPILGLIADQLNQSRTSTNEDDELQRDNSSASSIQANHHSELLSCIAQELGVTPGEIHDFELSLYDTQPSVLGGLNNEFVFSPRLDNLMSSFCAVEALADHVSTPAFASQKDNVNCIALFNHEEIGSVSSSGAESSLIPSLLERLSPTPSLLGQSIARSILISADMGHAVHPNFASKHEDKHRPVMNGGIVIKTNAKQRYASDAIGTFLVKQLVERKGGRVQEFEVRNDMPCGSTVGPMLSKNGLRTVDVGNAMLSMHSIRETGGSHDVQYAIDLFSSLFEGFSELDKSLAMD